MLGEDCRVLNDSDASEESLDVLRASGELAKFRYLHFATHGKGNATRAFESTLILSQDNLPKSAVPKAGEPNLNGQLTASEVLEFWKLNAELVTLSACETAVGKAGGGDGQLGFAQGFAQAFLHAGSRSVCLSLWKVDDAATSLLMDRKETPFLVMPLMKGCSLGQRLKNGPPIPLLDAVRFTRETADGLAAAHARELVHRDIKPDNLWLEETAEGTHVRLLDFGLARDDTAQSVTRTGTIFGTPSYALRVQE